MMVVLALSRPIGAGRRDAFLSAVAGALAASPVRGTGAAHRIAREVQREYFGPPRMSDPGAAGGYSRSPKFGFVH
jgi:hypothetical protein